MRVVLLILLVFLCAFVLSDKTMNRVTTIRFFFCSVFALIISLNLDVPKKLIFVALTGYLVCAIVSLFFALNPQKGVFLVSKIALTIILIMAACSLKKDTFIKAMTALGLLLAWHCLYGLVTVGDQFPGVMGQRNLMASAQLLLLPFCVYSLLKFKLKFLSGLASGLILFNLIWLFNRASLLALVVSSCVAALYHKKLRYAVLVLVVVVSGYSLFQSLNTASIFARFKVWQQTLELVKESPVFGIGAGNWELQIPRYTALIDYPQMSYKVFFQRPHNDYIWVLAENGIAGFIFYLGIFGFALFYAIRSRNVLVLVVLSGYMVIAFFSFPMERPFHSLILAVCIGLAVAGDGFKRLKSRRLIFVPALCLCIIFGVYHKDARHIKTMMIARDKRKWSEVINEAAKVRLRTMDIFTLPVAWYTGEAHCYLGNSRQAVRDNHQAYRYNPNNIYVLDRLGNVLEALGDYDGAIKCYTRALGIKPDFKYSQENLINAIKKKVQNGIDLETVGNKR